MIPKPRTYLSALHAAVEVRVGERLLELRRSTCQHFAATQDWTGLEAFYAELLVLGVPAADRAGIVQSMARLPAIRSELDAALSHAIRAAGRNPDIRAIYCEYATDATDGSDAWTLDLFPCVRFARDDDDWACDFERVIDGPRIDALLRCEPEGQRTKPSGFIARDYFHAVLLSTFGRLLDQHADLRVPAGFAEHDHPIIYIGG